LRCKLRRILGEPFRREQLSLTDISDSPPVMRQADAAEAANNQARREPAEADDLLTVREVAASSRSSPPVEVPDRQGARLLRV
jgi:hypothetical protein